VEELHDLFFVTGSYGGIKLRRVRWAGQVARMGENKYMRCFNREPEGKRILRTTRNRKRE